MDGDTFIRMGVMQPDTIGVTLEQFPDVLFICRIPNCTEPEHIIEETVERIFPKTVFYKILSFGPGSKNPETTCRQLKTVNVTRGFISSDKEVKSCKGEKIMLERNGSILIVCSENTDLYAVNGFLENTGAIDT